MMGLTYQSPAPAFSDLPYPANLKADLVRGYNNYCAMSMAFIDAAGNVDWHYLDAWVAACKSWGARPIIPIGPTPTAGATTFDKGPWGYNGSPCNWASASFSSFVDKITKRYAGQNVVYELGCGNESNNPFFLAWTTGMVCTIGSSTQWPTCIVPRRLQRNTAYNIGDYALTVGSASNPGGYGVKCTVAGTTAATEPAYTGDVSSTQVDGTSTFAYVDTATPRTGAYFTTTAVTLDAKTGATYPQFNGVIGSTTTDGNVTWRADKLQTRFYHDTLDTLVSMQNSLYTTAKKHDMSCTVLPIAGTNVTYTPYAYMYMLSQMAGYFDPIINYHIYPSTMAQFSARLDELITASKAYGYGNYDIWITENGFSSNVVAPGPVTGWVAGNGLWDQEQDVQIRTLDAVYQLLGTYPRVKAWVYYYYCTQKGGLGHNFSNLTGTVDWWNGHF